MKNTLFFLAFISYALLASDCGAWEGFDASNADLVEILHDSVPTPGSSVDVHNFDSNTIETCIVESVLRNRKTIEIVVRDPSGELKLFVMEGR